MLGHVILKLSPSILCSVLICSVLSISASAQDADSTLQTYSLQWTASQGDRFLYMLSTSGTRGESIAVRTENFTFEAASVNEGKISFIAAGEPVSDRARLGYRFQRAMFPEFPFTVDSLGYTSVDAGQPFPVFLNIPVFPGYDVREGDIWSGGPIDILPDPTIGPIPFNFTSTLSSVADFRGERCAVIDTDYDVVLNGAVKSYLPFLGLVEGDDPEETGLTGQGALIGGVVENSRAHEAGILPGDMFVAVEGQRIRGWGGLLEIIPFLIPGVAVDFTVKRGEDELDVAVTPEGVPYADVTASGGLTSTVFFSLERGIPLKIDLTSEDLTFSIHKPDGTIEDRRADMHIILEYQYSV